VAKLALKEGLPLVQDEPDCTLRIMAQLVEDPIAVFQSLSDLSRIETSAAVCAEGQILFRHA
jgi:hypothetical protein